MYKYLVIFVLLFIVSCKEQSKEEVAQNKIKHYLEEVKGLNGYKPMMFGKLDSAFTSVKEVEEYQRLQVRYSACQMDEILNMNNPGMYSPEEMQANADMKERFKAALDSLEEKFIPEFDGWKMQHIYQTTDEEIGEVVNNYLFYFDQNLDDISLDIYTYRDLPLETYQLEPEFYQQFIER